MRRSSAHTLVLVASTLVLGAACSRAEGGGSVPAPAPSPSIAAARGACPVCADPESRGAILNRAINEASGLALSAARPGVVYVHNDSGDSARFFAITQAGADLGAFALEGAAAFDWEDMALGPCSPGGPSCLYFADTGDNKRQRASVTLYRVPEPASLDASIKSFASDAIPFVYPDGPHDAEALLVHPTTGVVTIVTKVKDGRSLVFELPMPLTPGQKATAVRVGEMEPPRGSPRITSGAVHPQGKGVLLRTYTHLFYYAMAPGQTAAQAVLGAACEMPVADESQGESVAWLPSGDGYVTVSEGTNAPLHVASCASRVGGQ